MQNATFKPGLSRMRFSKYLHSTVSLNVIKEMVNMQRTTIGLWMHLGGLLRTQEARVGESLVNAIFVF